MTAQQKKTRLVSKTYVFDKNFQYLRAFPTKVEATMKVRKKGCFFFSQKEIRAKKHLKLFADIKKAQSK